MSFLTGTNTELVYSMPAAGSTNTTGSTTNVIMTANTASNPAAYLPPLYSVWQPSSLVGKGFHVRMGGTFDLAGASNNTFSYGLNTTQGTATPATLLAGTGAIAWTTTIATGTWHAFLDIVVTQAGGSGAPAALLRVTGMLFFGVGNNAAVTASAATGVYMLGGAESGGVPGTVSVVPTTAYYWELAFAWSTGPTASYCTYHEILGLN